MAEEPSHIKQLSLIHVCKIGLKRDLSNDITLNPPLFSLVNTFKKGMLIKTHALRQQHPQPATVVWSIFIQFSFPLRFHCVRACLNKSETLAEFKLTVRARLPYRLHLMATTRLKFLATSHPRLHLSHRQAPSQPHQAASHQNKGLMHLIHRWAPSHPNQAASHQQIGLISSTLGFISSATRPHASHPQIGLISSNLQDASQQQ